MPTKKEIELYGDLIYQHKPTIRSLLINILEEKLFNLKRQKQSVYLPGAVFIPEPDIVSSLPLTYIALIKDDTVMEMIRVNVETAELIIDKKIKKIPFDPQKNIVRRGYTWNKKEGFLEKEVSDEQEDKL